MTRREDGGPAFPHLNPNFDGNWDKEPQRGGMSLRDWFAGQALMSMLSQPDKINSGTPALAARLSYQFADAMLAARAQTEE